MNTRLLRTLASIAETGSFVRTAERRNMTLSAVSMQMKSLEAELGVALFDRRFRPPKLTARGRAAVAEARRVLAAEDALVAACAGEGGLRGMFRIGFVLTASVRLLPGFMAAARARAPAARFQAETGLSEDLAERVRAGDLDAAVLTRSAPGEPTLNLAALAREEIVFAIPARAVAHDLSRLMEEMDFLQFMPRTGIGRLIAGRLEADGLAPRRTVVLDGIEAIMECVRAGLGFTALPKPDIERYGRGEITLRAMPTPLWRELSLATLPGSATDRAAAELRALFA